MILVADSGSTKADWLLLDEQGTTVLEFNTMGLNPFFHDGPVIMDALSKVADLADHVNDVAQVFFYGAGCSSATRCEVIADGLKRFFKQAYISVKHDTLGAAYATCGDQPGIACILGTGSNSCYFDGENVSEVYPALGYILGDEGAGSNIGKEVIRQYLYKNVPEWLAKALSNAGHTKEKVFDQIYTNPVSPNRYLASFAKFLSMRPSDPFTQALVYSSINEFFEYHVLCFKNYREVPVHFIGSIAFHFKPILEQVAKQHEVSLGNIIHKPIQGLADYHMRQHSS